MMKTAVTGARGFIGKNLVVALRRAGVEVAAIGSDSAAAAWRSGVAGAAVVFHLAGTNRPEREEAFVTGNVGSLETLFTALDGGEAGGESAPRPLIVLASSTQAANDTPYGRSKAAAEQALEAYAARTGTPAVIYRLPGVFGKWCRPDYNSVVATFCHRIARGAPIVVNDPAAPLQLVYVDDVVNTFIALLDAPRGSDEVLAAGPLYTITVGELAAQLREFAASRESMVTPRVGVGLLRALYATYISYLPTDSFAYRVPSHTDPRGEFVEMLKTPDCGQFSYFTAGPGITRGEHYHHSKTEKFLIVRGTARFGFRHMVTNEVHELVVAGGAGNIVETIPGWAHNITNVGSDELVVMLWASEIFDRERPDTVAMKVRP
jgi:UDP-2-acetamido-2,6-beta-L-arabino-hexul-4-ose reductase